MTKWIMQKDGTFKEDKSVKKKWKKKKDGTFEEVIEEDIAPVNTSGQGTRTWFQKGLFEDGYDFGDVTKTLFATHKDIEEDAVKGLLGIGEGAIDFVSQGASGLAKKFGNDELADKITRFQERDLVEETKIAERLIDRINMQGGNALWSAGNTLLNKGQTEKVSVLGEKSDSLVQSAGQLAGTIALQSVGVPWWLTTGVSSFGAGVEEAYKNDATWGEASGYGVIKAGADVLTEKLSGGIKFGGKALDDVLTRKLSEAISNKTLKTMARFGMAATGEGAEEIVAEVVGNVGKGLTYEDEKTVWELVTNEEAMDGYLEAFIGGAVLGGGMNTGRAYRSLKTGRDYDTGLSDSEQTVIDSEAINRQKDLKKYKAMETAVDEAIRKQEETVGKLTDKAKLELRNKTMEELEGKEFDLSGVELSKEELAEIETQVKEDFDKGYISTDTIENALFPDRTKKLRELMEERKTADDLRKADIDTEMESISKSLDGFLNENYRLKESYRQAQLRNQEFQAEVTEKDSDLTKSLVEEFKKHNVGNNRRAHETFEFYNKLSNDSGIKIKLRNTEELKAAGRENAEQINGFITPGTDGKYEIVLNVDHKDVLNVVAGHEITHTLEGGEHYAELQKALKEYATTKGVYDKMLSMANAVYNGVENANVEGEVTAQLAGEYLLTDEAFVKKLAAEKPNIFKRVFDEIKHIYKMAVAGSKEARQLEKAKRMYEKAYSETRKTAAQPKKTNSTTEADSNTKKGTALNPEVQSLDISDPVQNNVTEKEDSVNKELTEEQQEYFKDSKVRDEEGNLKVMYHGTSAGGHTMFDPYGKAKYGLFGVGSYFTDNKDVAESYTEKGKGDNKQIYEVYLNITNPIDMDAPAIPTEWKNALPEADFPQNGTNEAFYRAMEEYFEGEGYAKWEASETALEVLEGMGYDGITHIGGGRFNKKDETRHQVYIAFQPEQIKNIDNAKPTTDSDIRYSLSPSGTATKYSYTSWNNTDKSKVLSGLTDAGFEKKDAEKWIDDVNGIASIIASDRDRLDYEAAPNQTMLKKNQEYVRTLDSSTLCAKRLLFQGTYDAIQRALPNVPLLADDVIKLRRMMDEKGYEVPCGICYVESRRKSLGKFASQWLDTYNGEYVPTLAEVTATDGLEKLRVDHPQTYRDFVKAMKTKGVANPKLVELRTDYRGEIRKLSKRTVNKVIRIGGLRIQSFSDFETPHMIDMMQAVLDMSGKKLTAQAYTKVPNFAWVFGDTGVKINLSLIGDVDADGNLTFDSKEGMAIEDALALRDAYSENVGTILVGKNREHILAAMQDDRIDFIIPFHRSGWGSAEYEKLGLQGYTDFTAEQTERNVDGSKRSDGGLYSIDYWDFSKSGKENAERYLEICKEQGRRPVFYSFLVDNGDGSWSLQPDGSTDGYWKMLIDYKMYDNNGIGSPQKRVKPNFNMEQARRVLSEYEGGANTLPVAQDIVDEFVSQYSLGNMSDLLPPRRGTRWSDIMMPGEGTISNTETVEDVAPVRPMATERPQEPSVDMGRALSDEDLPYIEQQGSEALRHITEDYEYIEDGLPYELPPAEVKNPLEGRNIEDVGNRSVKAYMYENPEVKPFFQREAQTMLSDLRDSTKGQRFFNDQVYYDTNGEHGFFGSKRNTSEEIAYLLDNFKYTYADIEKGLQAIIEDNGKENNAVSKRIEFLLDERLREGYNDFMYGDYVEPDNDYLNLLREKQITEYNDEAYEMWVRSLADVEAPEEVAPVSPVTERTPAVDIAPVRETAGPTQNGVQQAYDFETETITEDKKDVEIERLEKRKQAEYKKLGSLVSFTSRKATELYDEVKSMRKGVRVSSDLGYILDNAFYGVQKHEDGYEVLKDSIYRDITDALLDVESNPAKVVNPKSKVESVIRKAIEQRYNWSVKEIDSMKLDSRAKARQKIRNSLVADENMMKMLMQAKDKPKLLLNNTDTVRVNEIVFGRDAGKRINELVFQKTFDNEAKNIRWKNQERADLKSLGIKPKSKMSAAVQKYGEGEYVNEFGDMVKYDDDALAREFPKKDDQVKIINAANFIRNKYDVYIDTANDVLTSLGFDPIPKRKDYMRHFQALNDIFSEFGTPFNPQVLKSETLPTDINGMTEFFTPQKNFFANAMEREGARTTLDAITGIDEYLEGIGNLIYHTEDIQRGRALEELVRSNFGRSEGAKKIEEDVTLTDDERLERLEKIKDNHLSNYAAWLREWTNNVAGKKSGLDRGFEHALGRIFPAFDELRKQVGSNMIGFNLSSSLTNAIASVQAMAKTNKVAVTKGTVDTFRNIVLRDDFIDKNEFLTARFGSDKISKTLWEKVRDSGYIFMKGMDYFTSNQIVRSKYHELISKGMSEEQAHTEAGRFAARIMGDRTKGANPLLYNSKAFNIVAQFQLEVNNQLYSMFYDTYHESKEKANDKALRTAAAMTFTLGQLFGFTHLFGKGFDALAGYNPTLDVIGIFATALGMGDDDEEDKPLADRLEDASMLLLKALPYSSLFVDGGRIPIGQALPVTQFIKGEDEYGNEKSRVDIVKETLPYYVMPGGYNQIKKTTKGLGMFDEDLPISGSYTDSGNLRFPVEDTIQNRIQAGLFGQWASENAGEYFDREEQPLKEKQIQEFKELDIPIAEYWDIRKGLKEHKKTEDKLNYIADLDLPFNKKNIMANNVTDRKEPIDMEIYDDFGSLEEFDFAMKNPEKYVMTKAVGGYKSYKAYSKQLNDIKADKDSDGKSISGSRKEKVIGFVNSLDADYGAKLVLFKSEYPADDTYNYEIINYLNSRGDISYEETETILKELGFVIDADGTVRW